jgi:SepF-like predicted cell division protein (DUF552 family)
MICVKYENENGDVQYIPLKDYCERVSKRNNSVLFKIEKYLGIKMLSDEVLKEVRNIILDTSADVSRLPNNIIIYEYDGCDLL